MPKVHLRNNWNAPNGVFYYKGTPENPTDIPDHMVEHLPKSAKLAGEVAPKVKPLPIPRRPTTLAGEIASKAKKVETLADADPARIAAEVVKETVEAAEGSATQADETAASRDPAEERMAKLKAAREAAAGGRRGRR